MGEGENLPEFEKLRNLKLHEHYLISKETSVMRIPGGLLYTVFNNSSIHGANCAATSSSVHTQFITFAFNN